MRNPLPVDSSRAFPFGRCRSIFFLLRNELIAHLQSPMPRSEPIALVRGYRNRRPAGMLLLMLVGLAFIFGGAWWGDRLPSHAAEILIPARRSLANSAVCDRRVRVTTRLPYLPPNSPRKNPSRWDRASSQAGSLPATRIATPRDSMSGVRQFLSFWLRTLTSVGNARLA